MRLPQRGTKDMACSRRVWFGNAAASVYVPQDFDGGAAADEAAALGGKAGPGGAGVSCGSWPGQGPAGGSVAERLSLVLLPLTPAELRRALLEAESTAWHVANMT